MTDRRRFIKTMFVGAVGIVLTQNSELMASSRALPKKVAKKIEKMILPLNVIFSKKNDGTWKNKGGSHAPIVTIKDGKVTIETKHGMSKKHYIVRHTLVTSTGVYIGGKTFYPKDKAISVFELPKGDKSFIATSYCNKHDLWITEFNL